MTVIDYRELVFTGKSWKPVTEKTTGLVSVTGGSSSTILDPKGEYCVITNLVLINTDTANATTVTLKDGTKPLDIISLSAGERKESTVRYVIEDKLIAESDTTNIYVSATYKISVKVTP